MNSLFNESEFDCTHLDSFHDMLLSCYPDFYDRNIAPLEYVPQAQYKILKFYQEKYLNGELTALQGE